MSGVFERVLCGADGSPGGIAAARLGARLAAPDGVVEVVSVGARELAGAALAGAVAAAEPLHHAEAMLTEGGPAGALLGEIERFGASLVVVGGGRHSRAVGIARGSIATFLLHEAPCSVLLARTSPADPLEWPRSVVAGVDGSAESARSLAAAEEVAVRFGAWLRPVAASRDAHVDLETARLLAPGLEEHRDSAVALLADLSEEADLLVVGSRGLKGVRSLGSVSERVAHEARCPVLVVRPHEP